MYTKHWARGKAAVVHDVSIIGNASNQSKYWIGFMYANANYLIVKKQIKGLRINCTSEEIQHLAGLSQYLGYNARPVPIKKDAEVSVLNIYSTELVRMVSYLGLESSMRDRQIHNANALHHDADFWRGFFDGNGMVIDDGELLQIRLQVNAHMYDYWLNFVRPYIGEDFQSTQHKLYTEWITTDESAKVILQLLYNEAEIASPRNYEIAYSHLTNEMETAEP